MQFFKMTLNGTKYSVFRAALNTKTIHSNGLMDARQAGKLYIDMDFQAIAFTDQGFLNHDLNFDKWLNYGFDQYMGRLLGTEYCFSGKHGEICLLAIGIPRDFPSSFSTAQQAIDAVKQAGGVTFCAHPYASGVWAEDLLALKGLDGFELYNGSCRPLGKALSDSLWDEMLDMGGRPYTIATDGLLRFGDFMTGWTMVCAKDCQPDSILDGLRQGNFYATQGPLFHCIEYRKNRFHAEFTEAVNALLIGDCPHKEQRFNGFVGRLDTYPVPGIDRFPPVTSIDADLSAWDPGTTVRCQIQDAQGRLAWSQAYPL